MDKAKEILVNKLGFSSESIDKLSIFHDELLKYNKKYNLISKSTEKSIWWRHILDSAQIYLLTLKPSKVFHKHCCE